MAQFQVKNHFSFSGKKDVAVNVSAQDYTGFLWLGTNEGLYKYNGRQAYEVEKNSRILKQPITALYFDVEDKAWIGTASGKVYTVLNGKLDSLDFGKQPNTDKITAFCRLKNGLAIGTYGNGLFVYTNNNLIHYGTDQGLCDNVIYDAVSDGDNTIWCGTDAGVAVVKNAGSKAELAVLSSKNGLPDNIVRDLSYHSDKILVAMQDSGVCTYNLKSNLFEKNYVKGLWNYGTVVYARLTPDRRLLVGTEKNGLVEFYDGKSRQYDYNSLMMVHSVNHVFADNTGQLWVASKKGISQFDEKRFNLIQNIAGLSDDRILAIACDQHNDLWVGTTMGVSKLENGPGSTMAMGADYELSKFTISCAAEAPDGSIWFGSYGNGISILKRGQKGSTILNSANSKLSNDNISHIYFGTDGLVYISTLGAGVMIARMGGADGASIAIVRTLTENEGLANNYVYATVTDKQGRLVIGTDGGGLQLYENGNLVNLTRKFKVASNTIFSLCCDKYGNIWATTNADGILKYDGTTMQVFGKDEGLRDLQPQQILAVDNLLYAFNSKGIDRIHVKDHTVSYYDLFDEDLEPNLNAVYYADGKIFSGTNKGLLVFRSGAQRSDSVKPTAYIKSLQINYKPFPIDSTYRFPYTQNNISIQFDGVWLKAPDKLTFRYRLNGLEENWLYAAEGKEVSYNNLSPGEYTFILQSKNEDDIWSEPVGYHFVILTPLWKRPWFWILLFAVVAVVLYLLFRYRIRALKRQNELLEQRVVERTREIAEQSRVIEEKNKELELLSLVASKTENVVLILDAQGHLEYVNESFVRRHKLNMAELKQLYGETIFEFSNNGNIRQIVSEAISTRRAVSYESHNQKIESEEEIWESSTLTPIFGDDGVLRKLIIIDSDVTQIKRQEQIIRQKNKDITDSIEYASRIQKSILPARQLIRKHLPELSMVYLTKDIVSGDFYWFDHFGEFSIIAAIDCTGHGVPGAFMSLIGYSLLNRIVNEKQITDPAQILLELNNGIIGALHRSEQISRDGMDVAICKIYHGKNKLDYAGALRPLWIINKTNVTEIKPDKIPIGTKPQDRKTEIHYTTHTVEVQPGDSFYIFTDGYADQFGGPLQKKFNAVRLKELLTNCAQYDFEVQEQMIKDEHRKWRGNTEQVDDILIIGFRVS